MTSYTDRILGGLIGVALGDALGVPHEFHWTTTESYTGVLQHRLQFRRKYQPSVLLGVGQVSDDTEMTLALARCLVRVGHWNREEVAKSYMTWANSAMSIGRNTRQLFKGVRTYAGFVNRYRLSFGILPEHGVVSPGDASQSNGTLMRAFPLACLDDVEVEVNDALLTNPNTVNVAANMIYVGAVRLALRGRSPREIWEYVVSRRHLHKTIGDLITAVETGEDWQLNGEKKGWVLYSLYMALVCLHDIREGYNTGSFSRAMYWVIHDHPGSDTTNAAIAGGLLGAIMGADMMLSDPVTKENYARIRHVTETDVPRPIEYTPHDLPELAAALAALRS